MLMCIESTSINNIINIIVLKSSFKVKNELTYLQKSFSSQSSVGIFQQYSSCQNISEHKQYSK